MLKFYKRWHRYSRDIFLSVAFVCILNSLFIISVYLSYGRAVFLNFTVMLKNVFTSKMQHCFQNVRGWSQAFLFFYFLTSLHVYVNEKLVNCFHHSFVDFQNFSCLVTVYFQKNGKGYPWRTFCSFSEAVITFHWRLELLLVLNWVTWMLRNKENIV